MTKKTVLSISPWSTLLTKFCQFLYTLYDSLHYEAVFSPSSSKALNGICSLMPHSTKRQPKLPAHWHFTASQFIQSSSFSVKTVTIMIHSSKYFCLMRIHENNTINAVYYLFTYTCSNLHRHQHILIFQYVLKTMSFYLTW